MEDVFTAPKKGRGLFVLGHNEFCLKGMPFYLRVLFKSAKNPAIS